MYFFAFQQRKLESVIGLLRTFFFVFFHTFGVIPGIYRVCTGYFRYFWGDPFGPRSVDFLALWLDRMFWKKISVRVSRKNGLSDRLQGNFFEFWPKITVCPPAGSRETPAGPGNSGPGTGILKSRPGSRGNPGRVRPGSGRESRGFSVSGRLDRGHLRPMAFSPQFQIQTC